MLLPAQLVAVALLLQPARGGFCSDRDISPPGRQVPCNAFNSSTECGHESELCIWLDGLPARPAFSESFSVRTVEVDDTLNGSVSVRQVLHRDYSVHRSWMSANGSLAHGAEEQIMRCDIHPVGWLVVAGGPDTLNLTSWDCNNQSIDSDPQSCQWSPFWPALPANATYSGLQTVDGRLAHEWRYWMGGEVWALWASLDGRSPVATGKVWTYKPTDHLWRILWRNFTEGRPPAADFDLTPGIQCDPAPPPPPPPTPFEPATDCKPSCGIDAMCCQDPRAPPPGVCFNVKNCSSILVKEGAPAVPLPAPRTRGVVHQPPAAALSLEELHAAADHRVNAATLAREVH